MNSSATNRVTKSLLPNSSLVLLINLAERHSCEIPRPTHKSIYFTFSMLFEVNSLLACQLAYVLLMVGHYFSVQNGRLPYTSFKGDQCHRSSILCSKLEQAKEKLAGFFLQLLDGITLENIYKLNRQRLVAAYLDTTPANHCSCFEILFEKAAKIYEDIEFPL